MGHFRFKSANSRRGRERRGGSSTGLVALGEASNEPLPQLGMAGGGGGKNPHISDKIR